MNSCKVITPVSSPKSQKKSAVSIPEAPVRTLPVTSYPLPLNGYHSPHFQHHRLVLFIWGLNVNGFYSCCFDFHSKLCFGDSSTLLHIKLVGWFSWSYGLLPYEHMRGHPLYHLDCFPLGARMNGVAVNLLVHVFRWRRRLLNPTQVSCM